MRRIQDYKCWLLIFYTLLIEYQSYESIEINPSSLIYQYPLPGSASLLFSSKAWLGSC